MASAPYRRYSGIRVEPSRDPHLAIKRAILLAVSTTFARGQLLTETANAGTNETQTLTIGGTPTAGPTSTFTVTLAGVTTGPILWSATNATLLANMQAAFDAAFGVANIIPTANSLTAGIGTITLTFVNDLGYTNVALATATSSLTGTSPTVAIANTTAGVAGTYSRFDRYVSGTGTPRCILPVACTTDASGNITLGDGTAGGDHGTVYPSFYAWFGGYFFAKDCTVLVGSVQTSGMSATPLSAIGGKMTQGVDLARAEFKF